VLPTNFILHSKQKEVKIKSSQVIKKRNAKAIEKESQGQPGK